METKKSKKADLGNKRGMFLQIGLLVALSMAVAAFGYSESEIRLAQVIEPPAAITSELPPIPTQDEKRDVKVLTFNVNPSQIRIVPDNARIVAEIPEGFFDEGVIFVPKAAPKEEKTVEDPFVWIAEVMPTFMGGELKTFREWVLKRIKYPEAALQANIYGRVTIQFVIEKDGSISNIEVIQAPDRALSEEAIRVLASSPKWSPGKQRGVPVRVKYTMPVDFRIE